MSKKVEKSKLLPKAVIDTFLRTVILLHIPMQQKALLITIALGNQRLSTKDLIQFNPKDTENSVKVALRELRRDGYIRIIHPTIDGQVLRNRWEIADELIQAMKSE